MDENKSPKKLNLKPFPINDMTVEWSEKSYQDTRNFFESIQNPEDYDKWANIKDSKLLQAFSHCVFPVGKKLMLEVEVTNSFMSRMLFNWMYSTSKYSNDNNLINKQNEIMGVHFIVMHYSHLSGFNSEEESILKRAAEIIQNKLQK